MKNSILIITLLASVFTLAAQDALLVDKALASINFNNTHEVSTISKLDKEATFPGGYIALQNVLQENLVYPDLAFEHEIEGTVNLRLLLNKNGELQAVKVINGVGGGCNQEAIRLVHLLPNWESAIQQGEEVAAVVVLQIKFGL